MCGISALISVSGPQRLASSLRAMTDIVRHRGPDGEGFAIWNAGGAPVFFGGVDTAPEVYAAHIAARPQPDAPKDDVPVSVALGHRRLAILDCTPSGHQPMMTAQGEAAIVFNGEIYNHDSIREELRGLGHRFVGRSDTEVILHAFLEWGADCLRRFNGMFAFVLFEPRSGRVLIARDRYGVKPCYLWRSPAGFVAIASEIKQFTVLPGWNAVLRAQGAYDFLTLGITDHRRETLFRDVLQLRGGEYLQCPVEQLAEPEAHIRRWYTLAPAQVPSDFDAASEQFAALFTDAVDLRLHADVPVGTGLSGGLDSSSIVCTANRLLRSRDAAAQQNTYSACAHVSKYDERQHIDRVVEHTGVRAHYTYPELDEFIDAMPAIAWHQDEPIGGASVFAEWSVFRLTASTPVKVTLDGHGADELLAGYHSFFGPHFAGLFWRGRWLKLLREARAARLQHGYGPRLVLWSIASFGSTGHATSFLRRLAGRDQAASADWLETRALGIEEYDLMRELGSKDISLGSYSVSQMMASSLPFQLRNCDRDSMAHSIESRAPFLDYRVAEFALGCPDEFKLAHGTTKRLLRKAMRGVLPEGVLRRQDKMGFVTPEQHWICEAQPQVFKALAAAAAARAQGVVNGRALQRACDIIDGRVPFDPFVMRLIAFAHWLDAFKVAVR